MNSSTETPTQAPAPAASYEAPVIEQIVTLEELEREVHYAGSPSTINL